MATAEAPPHHTLADLEGVSRCPETEEALALSQIYLDVRFGGGSLTLESERSFRTRLTKLRQLQQAERRAPEA